MKGLITMSVDCLCSDTFDRNFYICNVYSIILIHNNIHFQSPVGLKKYFHVNEIREFHGHAVEFSCTVSLIKGYQGFGAIYCFKL